MVGAPCRDICKDVFAFGSLSEQNILPNITAAAPTAEGDAQPGTNECFAAMFLPQHVCFLSFETPGPVLCDPSRTGHQAEEVSPQGIARAAASAGASDGNTASSSASQILKCKCSCRQANVSLRNWSSENGEAGGCSRESAERLRHLKE